MEANATREASTSGAEYQPRIRIDRHGAAFPDGHQSWRVGQAEHCTSET